MINSMVELTNLERNLGMGNYQKRGQYKTIEEYILYKTGKSLQDLDHFKSQYIIANLDVAAEKIIKGIQQGKKFGIYGDYDADGITSVAQLYLLMQLFGGNATYKLPRRFTDGYGINPTSMDALGKIDILITIDNGISAVEAVQKAVNKGILVIVLDHHMATESKVSSPNVMVDPEAYPNGNDYINYCGAGLAYKLLEYMVHHYHSYISKKPEVKKTMMAAASYAAIGTIADVVPLTEDNRRIVKLGLWALNHNHTSAGLIGLIKLLGIEEVTSSGIAFQLAPTLNSAGRLYDKGATYSIRTILENRDVEGLMMARKLVDINNTRKQIVKDIISNLPVGDVNAPINFIPCSGSAGIMGLIAGDLTEKDQKPSFVYSIENGICKGSARSDDESKNNVKQMLDTCQDLLLAYGGHPGAAGFSFLLENETAIRQRLYHYPVIKHESTKYYDLEISADDSIFNLKIMDVAEPFGKDIERPIFRIKCDIENTGNVILMGGDKTHLKFLLDRGLQAVAFGMKERYYADGQPKSLYLYGDLIWNKYKGVETPNLHVYDYEIIR